METQQDIDQLAAAIYRDKVLRSRAMTPDERLMESFRLFHEALTFTKAGVADELGTTDETVIMAEVQRRFEVVRTIEERGSYQPWPPPSAQSQAA
ncbi:MAG: hypothetical protein Q8M07_19725 [Prosthecobacter sp.]|nr:hypothetical protein [Prosthecobacter sp.]HBJ88306.1 hypothetical protein [Verrucomicrobiales bacterium]